MTSLAAGAVALLMTLTTVGVWTVPGPPDRASVVDPGDLASTWPATGSLPMTGAGVVRTPARVPPAQGRPVRRFERPAHDYAAGHRGTDLAATPGQAVVSPTDGIVRFVGPVAGRGVVVVAHADDTLTSLEPVTSVLPVGAAVRSGEVVASVADTPVHAGCRSTCVHWGVRVQGRYVDPWWWLGRYGAVRLLPLSDR